MVATRMWPLLGLALLATTCMRGARSDEPLASAIRQDLPPISLLTADGVELELLAVDAKVLLVEPLAFTELHLRFRNPEERTIEGRFRVVLPPTAAVARFAMKVQNRWEEAELVELAQAREAYELFLHRRQDPALLERSAGNEFSARVFPITAREEKELIIGYSEDLVQPDRPYRLALRGIRSPAHAEITLMKSGEKGLTQQKLKVPTTQDFEQPLAGGDIVLRHGKLVVGRIAAPGTVQPAPIHSLAVLFDTSASRALGLAQQVELLRSILAEARRQGADFHLRVLAFDQEVADIYDGRASGFGDAQARVLLERGALGASNLELALRTLVSRASKPVERILIIGDGVNTAGALDGARLTQRVADLAKHGARRLDALAVGGVRDEARIAALTAAGLPEDGVMSHGGRPTRWLWSRLTRQATHTTLPPAIGQAPWSWPREPRGVLPGDAMMMLARLESADAPVALPNVVTVADDLAPLLERAHARAQLAQLEQLLDQTADGKSPSAQQTATIGLSELLGETPMSEDALKARVIETSIAARVLSRLTGFVVLENDSAWRRANVKVAPTKIMSLDATGLRLVPHARGCCEATSWQTPISRSRMAIDEQPESEIVMDRAVNLMQDMRASESRKGSGVLELLRPERSSAPAARAAPPAPPAAPAPATEPAAVSDGTSLSGLPALPPEPQDALANTTPEILRGGSQKPKQLEDLPKPPTYRAADFAKLPKAYTGRFADIMALLARGKLEQARAQAEAWRTVDPGQALAQVALGEACRAMGDRRRAARAFGSIIDLFPARADLRRFAAGRLASLKDPAALALAIDSAWRAVEQRPDHPSGHHLAATFLLEAGRHEQALAVLTLALDHDFDRRFVQADRVLREDAALVVEAWIKAEPHRAGEARRRQLRLLGTQETEPTLQRELATRETVPSLRFVLTWESDANDVDFHIRDGHGYHASYARPSLPTGGELYADVRDGYGPECFTIRGSGRAYPYRLSIRYARRGPMGYGMGTVQIIEHDGQGGLRFDHRPFVIMSDGGYLELAEIPAPH